MLSFCICLLVLWLQATPYLHGPCPERVKSQRSCDMGDDMRQLVKAAMIWNFPLHIQRGLANPCLWRSSCHLATMITDHFCHLSLLPLAPSDLTLFPLDFRVSFQVMTTFKLICLRTKNKLTLKPQGRERREAVISVTRSVNKKWPWFWRQGGASLSSLPS